MVLPRPGRPSQVAPSSQLPRTRQSRQHALLSPIYRGTESVSKPAVPSTHRPFVHGGGAYINPPQTPKPSSLLHPFFFAYPPPPRAPTPPHPPSYPGKNTNPLPVRSRRKRVA